MGYNTGKEPLSELWAVLDIEGRVMWSRGGSSSTPKPMVYATKGKAEGALKSPWTKQAFCVSKVRIEKIYSI